MQVVIARPAEPAQVTELEPGLAALQAAVGGYVDLVRGDGFDLWINDEGALNGMPANRVLGRHTLFGPIVAAGHDGEGNTVGLDATTCERVVALLNGTARLDAYALEPVFGFQDILSVRRYP